MNKVIIAALFMLLGTSAYAGPPVSVCDPSSLGNCVKPNSDGSVNISGSVTAGGVTQASTTSGQSGNLTQGAATTSAPTYTNGTTNPLSLDTSGNLRVNVVTGASSGAVSQGSTTSGQTGPLVQCSVTTAAPTYTTAQTDPLNCATTGALRVIDSNSAALLTAAQAAIPAGSAIIGKVGIDQTTDGTTNAVHLVAGTAIAGKVGIDQTTPGTTNAVQAIAGTTGGTTPFTLTAANTTNATNIKASAGLVDHVSVYNISATPAWVSFYDTSGTPTCGTAIKYQVLAPANSTSGAGAVEDYAIGVGHASGIGICFTTGIAGTGAVAASTYVVNVFYK